MSFFLKALLYFLLHLVFCGSINPHLKDVSSVAECNELEYRNGYCNECNCAPKCWSCPELRSKSYDCAKKNGVHEQVIKKDAGTITVGTNVDFLALSDDEKLPVRGWSQCASTPSLPVGLVFSDTGRLSGTLGYNSRVNKDSYEVLFTVYNTSEWSKSLYRLDVRFQVIGNVEANGKEECDSRKSGEIAVVCEKGHDEKEKENVAIASAEHALNTGFGAYNDMEAGKISYNECLSRMRASTEKLLSLLNNFPFLGGGKFWSWLGALHMNRHKLLDNCLIESERYLARGLLFPNKPVRGNGEKLYDITEHNLAGCYAKRQLEAARFLLVSAVKRIIQLYASNVEEALIVAGLDEISEILKLSSTKKSGFGWGVNNGEIHLTLASVEILQFAHHGKSELLKEARASIDYVKDRTNGKWASHISYNLGLMESLDGNDYMKENVARIVKEKLLLKCKEMAQRFVARPRPKTLPTTPLAWKVE
eukprot:g5438.t1